MSWVAPRTWTAGLLVGAADLNEQVRDLFKYIGGPDGRGTSLPAGPVDGQLFVYTADNSAGIEWLLKYMGSEATYKWRAVGRAVGLRADATGTANTTSTSYVATTACSLTLPLAGDYEIVVGAQSLRNHGIGASEGTARLSFAVSSLFSGVAQDTWAAQVAGSALLNNSITGGASVHRSNRVTGVTASSTVTAYHRSWNASATNGVINPYLEAVPIRVV